MNNTEQGVLKQDKLIHLLIRALLPLFLCITQLASAETPTADHPKHEQNTPKHHVFMIYSPDNTLHSNILQKLSENLKFARSDIIVSKVRPEEKIKKIDNKHDIIIAIGPEGMKSADKHYPKSKKLFISTDPNKYKLEADKNKNDAILYMTQSFCRQIRFMKLLNPLWKTISIIYSEKKPVDSTAIRQCANKYDIKIYTVSISTDESLTDKLKHGLQHSDVLLALPDSNIYNSKTVKNILLTSYRYRKPVIAFSQNFVNAGALASIHSNAEQIAQSASKIIEHHFATGATFEKSIYYPDGFDISINRQVFRALDLPLADTNKIKKTLEQTDSELTGNIQ